MEARAGQDLEIAKRGGLIRDYRRQVSVDLIVNGKTVRKWRVDFEVERNDGTTFLYEIKGMPTPEYLIKRDLFLAIYPDRECWVNNERISTCGQARKFG